MKNKEPFLKVENFISKKFDLRLNVISHLVEWRMKGEGDYNPLNFESLYRDCINNKKYISQSDLMAVLKSDFTPRYNPVLLYFKGLEAYNPAKKTDYIEKLSGYVKVKNDIGSFPSAFKKMMVRCVACAVNDQVFNKHAFVLISEDQSAGKTTFIRFLCPPSLRSYYSESFSADKDGLIALSENFIINLDELASLSRIELNALKSLFSKDIVKVRRPYDKTATLSPRICNFFGSTNRTEFLSDETGNVRWLCFEVEKINFSYIKDIDINLVWAQAYYLYLTGFNYQLTPEEIKVNDVKNKSYFITSPEEELLRNHMKPETSETGQFMTASDIMVFLNEQYPHILRTTPVQIGRALKNLGYQKVQIAGEKTPKRGYYVKITALGHGYATAPQEANQYF